MRPRDETPLTGAQLARALGVTKQAVYNWMDRGMPYWPDPKGRRMYYLSEAREWRAKVASGEIKVWWPRASG